MNNTVVNVRCGRLSRIELISVSTKTQSAPAAGPKNNAAVMVSASEGEKLTGNPGKRTSAHPDTHVIARIAIHAMPGGFRSTSMADDTRASVPPPIVAVRYIERAALPNL